MTTSAERALESLRSVGATVATAESLTGGRLGAGITAIPGASMHYLGGVIAYATEVKTGLLGVDADLVRRDGVISDECARAMADRVRALTGATYGIATTGVAGPDRQEGKPVGTVHVAVSGAYSAAALALRLDGDRRTVVDRTCEEAWSALADLIAGEDSGLR